MSQLLREQKKKNLLVAVLLLLLAPLAVRAQVTAIKAGKLVDPETGITATNQVILIETGKIKAGGRRLRRSVAAPQKLSMKSCCKCG